MAWKPYKHNQGATEIAGPLAEAMVKEAEAILEREDQVPLPPIYVEDPEDTPYTPKGPKGWEAIEGGIEGAKGAYVDKSDDDIHVQVIGAEHLPPEFIKGIVEDVKRALRESKNRDPKQSMRDRQQNANARMALQSPEVMTAFVQAMRARQHMPTAAERLVPLAMMAEFVGDPPDHVLQILGVTRQDLEDAKVLLGWQNEPECSECGIRHPKDVPHTTWERMKERK